MNRRIRSLPSIAPMTLALLSLVCAPTLQAEQRHDHEADKREEIHHAGGPDTSEEHHGDAVELAQEALAEFGIELAVTGPGEITRVVTLPAEVRPNRDRLAHIAPRFPGIAREVRGREGDVVRANETLAIIESSGSLAPYPLKTAIAGVIIERHITRGEPVSPELGRVFTVADLTDVWIDISVYQKHLPHVRVGQSVRISEGHGLAEASGVISYLSPVVDEATRTVTARVELPNPNGSWRPGLFVTALVEVDRSQVAVAVPRTALEIVDGRPVVFVEGDHGFEPRTVTIGRQGAEFVEITRGLPAGVRYVSRGGFTLKAELAREELSGGHSH